MLAVIVLLSACSPALYVPSMDDAIRSRVSADSLTMGRTLYINHCGSCHNLRLPEHYTRKQWGKELPEMQQKAKISEEEAKLIANFVLARSKPE